jgi:hypothetical protein
MKDSLLKYPDSIPNVIIVDWSRGSRDVYYRAANATRSVAFAAAEVLDNLHKLYRINWLNTQCIGHSMGAHICGFIGKEMIKRGNKVNWTFY